MEGVVCICEKLERGASSELGDGGPQKRDIRKRIVCAFCVQARFLFHSIVFLKRRHYSIAW